MTTTPQNFVDIGGVLVPADGYDFTDIATAIGAKAPLPDTTVPVGLSATSYAEWQARIVAAGHTAVRIQGMITESYYSADGKQAYAMAPSAVQNDPAASLAATFSVPTVPPHQLQTVRVYARPPAASSNKTAFYIIMALLVAFVVYELWDSPPLLAKPIKVSPR